MAVSIGDIELRVTASYAGLSKASKALDGLTKKLERAAGAAERLQRATAAGMGRAAKAVEDSSKKQVSAHEKVSKAEKQLANQRKRHRQIQLNSAKMTGNLLVKQANQQDAALRKQSRAVATAAERYKNFRLQLVQLGTAQREIGVLDKSFERFRRNMRGGVLTQGQFVDQQNKLRAAFGAVDRKVKASNKVLGNSVSTFRELTSASVLAAGPLSQIGARMQALGSIANRTNLATAAFVGTAVAGGVAVGALGANAVSAASKFERYEAILMTATGSTMQANEELKQLMETSRGLGLRFDSLADGYAKLRVAGKGLGFGAKETMEIFEGFAAAGAALRVSGEQTVGMFRAIEQMMSKGNVQAEELRGQLGERLVGAFQFAAESMDVTTQELNKMLENGEVLAADLLPKMSKHLKETFGDAARKNVDSIRGAMANLSNAALEFFKKLDDITGLSDKFIGAVQGLSNWINGLTDNLRTVVDTLKNLGAALLGALAGKVAAVVITNIGSMVLAVRNFITALYALRTAVTVANIAALANPLGAVLTLLGGVAAYAYSTADNFGSARSAADSYRKAQLQLNSAIAAGTDVMRTMSFEESRRALEEQKRLVANLEERADNIKDRLAKGYAGDVGDKSLIGTENKEELDRVLERLERAKGRVGELSDLMQLIKDALNPDEGGAEDEIKKVNDAFKDRLKDLEKELWLLQEGSKQAELKYDMEAGELKGISQQRKEMLLALDEEIRKLEERRKLSKDATEEIESLERKIGLFGKETEAQKMLYEIEQGRYRELDKNTQRQLMMRARMLDSLEREQKRREELKKIYEDFGDLVSSTFEEMFFEFGKAQEILKSFLKDLARLILRTFIMKQMTNAIVGGLTGNSSSGVGVAGAVGDANMRGAKGLAFDGGVRKMAKGGLLDRPTMFGTRSGPALAGEAGTEAVMPLARLPGGDLGVMSAGGGGSPTVIVNIINESGEELQQAGQTTRKGPNGDYMIDVMVRSSMQRMASRGELDGLFAQYGASRRGTR